jgi:hypothetical protein
MALSPEDLRDLANLVQNFVNRGGPFHRFHLDLETEAARRDAEAKGLGRTQLADGVHHSAEAADCNPIVGRKDPGSADAPKGWPCMHGGECRTPTFCGTGYSAVCQSPKADKPAPAADDLHRAIDKLSGAVASFANSQHGQSQTNYKAQADALNARDEIKALFETQAREIASLLADKTAAEERIEALKARVARLTPELKWYGEQARLARLIHGEGDAGRHALAEDGGKRARAALAEANDAG